jgi:hypothetical protein
MLPPLCPTCRQEIAVDARFCRHCGQVLLAAPAGADVFSSPPPPPPPPPPGPSASTPPSNSGSGTGGPGCLGRLLRRGLVMALIAALAGALVAGFGVGPRALYRQLRGYLGLSSTDGDVPEIARMARLFSGLLPDIDGPPAWEPPGGFVAALDVTPAPGLRLQAARGALDKPRTFTASRLPDTDLPAIQAQIGTHPYFVGPTFRLDSGMKAEELFHDEVTVHFDLAALGIDAVLWPHLAAVQVLDDGTVVRPSCRLENGSLQAGIRHNGVISTVVVTTVIGLIGFYGYHESVKSQGLTWVHDATPRYCVYWSPNLPPATLSTDLRQEIQTIAGIAAEYNLRRGANGGIEGNWLAYYRFLRDPRLVGLEFSSKYAQAAWRRQHLWPVQVQNGVEALDAGYEYLVTRRGFLRPGVFDVYFRPDLPGTTADDLKFGEASSNRLFQSHMDLNARIIPAVRRGSPQLTATATLWLNELYTTAVHELFHIIQRSYYYIETTKHLWFMEAAAVALEDDAREYYLGRASGSPKPPLVTEFKVTDSTTHRPCFSRTMNLTEGTTTELQQHGYGQSTFFLRLRDTDSRYSDDEFLPTLMRTYRSYDVPTTLQRMCYTDKPLGACFRQFARDFRADFIERRLFQLRKCTLSEPYGHYTQTKWEPLSQTIHCIALAPPLGTSVRNMAAARAVIRWDDPAAERLDWSWTGNIRQGWTDLSGAALRRGCSLPIASVSAELRLYVQGVQAFEKAPDESPAATPFLYWYLVPPPAPKVTLETADPKRRRLNIEVNPSPLKNAPRSLVKEWRVTLTDPKTRRKMTVGSKTPRFDLKLAHVETVLGLFGRIDFSDKLWEQATAYLTQKLGFPVLLEDMWVMYEFSLVLQNIAMRQIDPTAAATTDVKLEVTVAEVADTLDEIVGPDGATATIVIPDPQRGYTDGPVIGKWASRMLLFGPLIPGFPQVPIEITGRTGAGIQGKLKYDQWFTFKGEWKPQYQGWEIMCWTIPTAGRRSEPLGLPLYLFPLRGRMMYMPYPPLVYRPEGAGLRDSDEPDDTAQLPPVPGYLDRFKAWWSSKK